MVLRLGNTTGVIECDTLKADTLQTSGGDDLAEWNFIASGSISSSVASLEIDCSAAAYANWDDIKFVVSQLTVVTDNVNVGMYVSTDGGSTYKSSYRNVIGRSTDATSTWTYNYSAARTQMEMLQGMGNAAWEYGQIEAIIYSLNEVLSDHQISAVGHFWADDTAPNQAFSSSTVNTASTTITHLKFQASSGNLDGGRWATYGRRF